MNINNREFYSINQNDLFICRDNSGGAHGAICPVFSKMVHQNSQISSIFYVLAHKSKISVKMAHDFWVHGEPCICNTNVLSVAEPVAKKQKQKVVVEEDSDDDDDDDEDDDDEEGGDNIDMDDIDDDDDDDEDDDDESD